MKRLLRSRLRAVLSDRYRIERELGSGGMATVYLAEDLKHGRQVAIKVLRPELAASFGVERFVREIEIAANLTHPHIRCDPFLKHKVSLCENRPVPHEGNRAACTPNGVFH